MRWRRNKFNLIGLFYLVATLSDIDSDKYYMTVTNSRRLVDLDAVHPSRRPVEFRLLSQSHSHVGQDQNVNAMARKYV